MIVQLVCRTYYFYLFMTHMLFGFFFFFKQKTAYEMRISDWSSDVCSSDLSSQRIQMFRRAIALVRPPAVAGVRLVMIDHHPVARDLGDDRRRRDRQRQRKIGSASCRERVCQYV